MENRSKAGLNQKFEAFKQSGTSLIVGVVERFEQSVENWRSGFKFGAENFELSPFQLEELKNYVDSVLVFSPETYKKLKSMIPNEADFEKICISLIGGKSFNIFKMQDAGIPCPLTVPLTTRFYYELIGSIQEDVQTIFPKTNGGNDTYYPLHTHTGENIKAASDVLKRKILEIKFHDIPAHLLSVLWQSYNMLSADEIDAIARSAKVCEDSPHAAFAGAGDSLHIKRNNFQIFCETIIRVAASAFNEVGLENMMRMRFPNGSMPNPADDPMAFTMMPFINANNAENLSPKELTEKVGSAYIFHDEMIGTRSQIVVQITNGTGATIADSNPGVPSIYIDKDIWQNIHNYQMEADIEVDGVSYVTYARTKTGEKIPFMRFEIPEQEDCFVINSNLREGKIGKILAPLAETRWKPAFDLDLVFKLIGPKFVGAINNLYPKRMESEYAFRRESNDTDNQTNLFQQWEDFVSNFNEKRVIEAGHRTDNLEMLCVQTRPITVETIALVGNIPEIPEELKKYTKEAIPTSEGYAEGVYWNRPENFDLANEVEKYIKNLEILKSPIKEFILERDASYTEQRMRELHENDEIFNEENLALHNIVAEYIVDYLRNNNPILLQNDMLFGQETITQDDATFYTKYKGIIKSFFQKKFCGRNVHAAVQGREHKIPVLDGIEEFCYLGRKYAAFAYPNSKNRGFVIEINSETESFVSELRAFHQLQLENQKNIKEMQETQPLQHFKVGANFSDPQRAIQERESGGHKEVILYRSNPSIKSIIEGLNTRDGYEFNILDPKKDLNYDGLVEQLVDNLFILAKAGYQNVMYRHGGAAFEESFYNLSPELRALHEKLKLDDGKPGTLQGGALISQYPNFFVDVEIEVIKRLMSKLKSEGLETELSFTIEFPRTAEEVNLALRRMEQAGLHQLENLKVGFLVENVSMALDIPKIILGQFRPNQIKMSIGGNDAQASTVFGIRDQASVALTVENAMNNPNFLITVVSIAMKNMRDHIPGASVSICGEVASDPLIAGILYNLGVRHFALPVDPDKFANSYEQLLFLESRIDPKTGLINLPVYTGIHCTPEIIAQKIANQASNNVVTFSPPPSSKITLDKKFNDFRLATQ